MVSSKVFIIVFTNLMLVNSSTEAAIVIVVFQELVMNEHFSIHYRMGLIDCH